MPQPSTPPGGDSAFIIATGNAGKRREFAGLLRPLLDPAWTVYDRNTFPRALPPIVEDQPTFLGNAIKKAVETALATNCCALADDSGLAVDALDGAPGVHSSRFAGEDADDKKNNELLLKRLENTPPDQRTARFITVLCLALPDNQVAKSLLARKGLRFQDIPRGSPEQPGILIRQDDLVLITFTGELPGIITTAPRGEQGFGYDPLFELPQLNKTLAQMNPDEKNRISHRAKAAQALHEFFS